MFHGSCNHHHVLEEWSFGPLTLLDNPWPVGPYFYLHQTDRRWFWRYFWCIHKCQFICCFIHYCNCRWLRDLRPLSGSNFYNWSEFNRSLDNLLFGRSQFQISNSWPSQNNAEHDYIMPCFAIGYRDERKCCNWLNCIHVCIRCSRCLHNWLFEDQYLQHGTQSKILWSIIFAPRLASFHSNSCWPSLRKCHPESSSKPATVSV